MSLDSIVFREPDHNPSALTQVHLQRVLRASWFQQTEIPAPGVHNSEFSFCAPIYSFRDVQYKSLVFSTDMNFERDFSDTRCFLSFWVILSANQDVGCLCLENDLP
jgi:hypothetical protein